MSVYAEEKNNWGENLEKVWTVSEKKKTLSLLPTLSQSRETRSHRHLLANRENYTRRISSLNTSAGLTALRVITAIWWPSIEFHAAYHYYHLVAINRMSLGVLLLPPSGHQ